MSGEGRGGGYVPGGYGRMGEGGGGGRRGGGGRERRTREDELEALDRELDGYVSGTVGGGGSSGGGRSGPRPTRTADDLDAEMDAWNVSRRRACWARVANGL